MDPFVWVDRLPFFKALSNRILGSFWWNVHWVMLSNASYRLSALMRTIRVTGYINWISFQKSQDHSSWIIIKVIREAMTPTSVEFDWKKFRRVLLICGVQLIKKRSCNVPDALYFDWGRRCGDITVILQPDIFLAPTWPLIPKLGSTLLVIWSCAATEKGKPHWSNNTRILYLHATIRMEGMIFSFLDDEINVLISF